MHATLTDTEVVPDNLEGLDYEYVPPCENQEVRFGFKVLGRVFAWGGRVCSNAADWAGSCPHCGDTGYTCNYHYRRMTGIWYCPRCKRVLGNGRVNSVIWKRL